MSFFCEYPWRLALTSIAVVIAGLWLARLSGQRLWFIAALMLIPVCGGLLLVERRIVTLREEIGGVLQDIAADLETNDVERVLRHVSPNRPELQRHARNLLPRYEVHRARVKSNLRVERVMDRTGEIARACFNAVFLVSERRGDIRNVLSPWYFVVDFASEDGEWRVVRYERHDPRRGMQRGQPEGTRGGQPPRDR